MTLGRRRRRFYADTLVNPEAKFQYMKEPSVISRCRRTRSAFSNISIRCSSEIVANEKAAGRRRLRGWIGQRAAGHCDNEGEGEVFAFTLVSLVAATGSAVCNYIRILVERDCEAFRGRRKGRLREAVFGREKI